MMKFPQKLVAAILSGIVFCAIASIESYTPMAQRREDTYYTEYLSIFLSGLLYILPFFILIGIAASLFLDKLTSRFNSFKPLKRYLLRVAAYAAGGIAVGIALTAVFSSLNQYTILFNAVKYTLLSSLLFYHAFLLVEPPMNKLMRRMLQLASR